MWVESPWSLLVLLFFAFVLPRLRTYPRWSAVRRGVAWLCLALALAGPALALGAAHEAIVILLDLSASASHALGPALGRLRAALATLPASVPATIVVFGATPVIAQPATSGERVLSWLERAGEASDTILRHAERDQTDIEAALDLAGWVLPATGGGRVLLVTDGWETRGDARRAVSRLAQRGIAVDTLEVSRLDGGGADASIDAIEAPAQVRADARFEIHATLRSTVVGRGTVTLLRDGRELARREVRLAPGDAPLRFASTVTTPGEHRYGVRVALDGDAEPRNDLAETPVSAVGRPRVLWIGPWPGPLPSGAPEIVHLRPADAAAAAPRLEDFDALVLSSVEAGDLPPRLMDRLPEYVGRAGGGLLMLGDGRSFGPGGYRRTPVEEVLPVELDAGARAQRPRLALVLVLDKSGSMAKPMEGGPKIAAARAAAGATAALLAAGDRLGIVAFDSAPTAVLELEDAAPGRLQATLDRLTPGGGTRILPALAEARRMAGGLEGWRRHIVLLTDGRGEGGDLPQAARDLHARGITLSVIAVGGDADTVLLRALAEAGGGRFEMGRSAERLTALLRREVAMARGPLVREERTAVVAERHAVLDALPGASVPPLLGWVAVTPKKVAVVPLRTTGGDALLALGRFGLGRSAALATDPLGRWGTEWQSWPGWPRLLANLLGWLARAPAAARVSIREVAERRGPMLEVSVEDAAGAPLNGRTLLARLGAEDGGEDVIALEQRAAGVYAGALGARGRRATSVVVEERAAGAARLIGRGWLGLGYAEEHRLRGPHRPLLDELRALSGGRRVGEPGNGETLRPAAHRPVRLWGPLAALGLGLFLLDLVLTRRSPAGRTV